MLIELFSLGVTSEALRANIHWKSAFFGGGGSHPFLPNFHVEGNVHHQPFLHGYIGQ